MRAGKMRHPALFERRETVKNSIGEPVEIWSLAFSARCEIEKSKSDSLNDENANLVVSDIQIGVHKTSNTKQITSSNFRVIIDGKIYQILEIDSLKSNRKITIFASNYD